MATKVSKSIQKAQRAFRREQLKEKREAEAHDKIVRAKQEAFEDGFKQGQHRGQQDATVAVRAQAFADMSNVWGQVYLAHKAAEQYAEIIAKMYQSRTNIRKAEDADGRSPQTPA